VGAVKSVEGKAEIIRDGRNINAAPGAELLQSDKVVTGADGAVGFTLRDNTTISVGPKTEMALDEFDFEPAQSKLKLVASVARGTMMMTSGTIAKLAPDAVAVVTKSGTIGVRGTRFVVSVDQ
jgi:hypothetical protein